MAVWVRLNCPRQNISVIALEARIRAFAKRRSTAALVAIDQSSLHRLQPNPFPNQLFNHPIKLGSEGPSRQVFRYFNFIDLIWRQKRDSKVSVNAAPQKHVEKIRIDVLKRAFEDKAIKLNIEGYNVYFVMNLISPEFRGNLRNTMAVSDADIIARRYLLIDIDRDDTTQPASMEELTEVVGVARDIQRHLREEFGYKPIRVFSGNGCHLYLSLANLPNTEENREYCHSILLSLARQFNTDSVKVDTIVYNASRITKLPGTVARKGLASEGRAYQLARVL